SEHPQSVFPGLGPGIHERLLVDGRAKPGQDAAGVVRFLPDLAQCALPAPFCSCRSRLARASSGWTPCRAGPAGLGFCPGFRAPAVAARCCAGVWVLFVAHAVLPSSFRFACDPRRLVELVDAALAAGKSAGRRADAGIAFEIARTGRRVAEMLARAAGTCAPAGLTRGFGWERVALDAGRAFLAVDLFSRHARLPVTNERKPYL